MWRPHDPSMAWTRKPRPLAERFWEKVEVRADDECWPWQGARGRHGYGNIGDGNGKTLRAHRVSYSLHVGPIPDGLVIGHHCDHPWCVNPAHLFAASQHDNLLDMSRKGRSAFGARSAFAKLSDASVVTIRDSRQPQIKLSRLFGVSPMTISLAKRRATWKHLP